MAIVLAVSGCSYSPTQDLFGSYFPAWMLCAAIGIVAAVIIRQILAVSGINDYVVAPLLIELDDPAADIRRHVNEVGLQVGVVRARSLVDWRRQLAFVRARVGRNASSKPKPSKVRRSCTNCAISPVSLQRLFRPKAGAYRRHQVIVLAALHA